MNSKAAVFEKIGEEIKLQNFKIPDSLEPGSLLCKIRFSTICGSDLHTITGKRKEPTPLILGHEMVGNITALGDEITYDGFGNLLSAGDRISWTIMASCGECFYCRKNLPQKCIHLKKYGHTSINDKEIKSSLLGGYSEYVYIMPGTTIYKVPDSISDEIAAPANCALSTVVNAVETIGIERDDFVMIQGAGLLGLNGCALAKEAGAEEIIITDINDERLELAKRFGATKTYNLRKISEEEILAELKELRGGYGIDVVIELCGDKSCIPLGIETLRTGGRYLFAGLVIPGNFLEAIDANQLIRKYITIKGVHNYHPDHLGKALKFLETVSELYPFDEIVKVSYKLEDINKAVLDASSGEYIRVGIRQ